MGEDGEDNFEVYGQRQAFKSRTENKKVAILV